MNKIKLHSFLTLSTLLFLFVLTQWSSSIYLPIAPKLANIFKGHEQLVTSSLSLFFLGYALGQFFWGVLSDFIGRYLAFILSLAMYLLFEALISFVSSGVHSFVAFLSLAGFAVSANTSVGNALIKDHYQEKSKSVIAYVGIAMACGPVVAPLIGTALYSNFGWKSIFVFLLAAGSLAAALFFSNFKQVSRPAPNLENRSKNQEKPSVLLMLKKVISDSKFIGYVVVLALIFGMFFALLLVIPFILEKIEHVSIDRTGFIVSGVTITYIAGAIANSFLIKKLLPSTIVKFSLMIVAAGGVLFLVNCFFIYGLLSFASLIAAAIAMLGMGSILPAAKAGAMIRANNNVGTYASVMKLGQTLGCVLLTKIASLFIASNNIDAFLFGMIAIVALLVVFGLIVLND
jgi:DHA1 family bicyclomycin/chloramphenicol resistance-like MFS transporter